jgi:hypothetical protein
VVEYIIRNGGLNRAGNTNCEQVQHGKPVHQYRYFLDEMVARKESTRPVSQLDHGTVSTMGWAIWNVNNRVGLGGS